MSGISTREQRNRLLLGAATIALGAAMAWGATDIPGEAGYGGVGPNFLPWLVALALALIGVLLLVQAWRGHAAEAAPAAAAVDADGADDADSSGTGPPRGDWDALAWISAGVLFNAAAIERLGFIASCAICYAFAVRGLRRSEGGGRYGLAGTATDLLIGAAIAAPAFWLFTKLLKINLPGMTGTGWF